MSRARDQTGQFVRKLKSGVISTEEALRLKQEELDLLLQKQKVMDLPHLNAFGGRWYKWAREFFESRNRMNFLLAANQISKSSTQIRKAIDWATDTDKWPQLWSMPPNQFWYLYPSQEVVNLEFATKWVQFLPRGKYKEDPKYGWKAIKDHGNTIGIQFNSGLYLAFKTYTKNVQVLQSGSVFAIFTDEELPEPIYDELIMRLNATDGYFHMVFTATIGQDIWRLTMEPSSNETEKFPQAAKWTISLYEAMTYEDGSQSHWTQEKINMIINKCKSQQEVLKRVYGRFILEEGRTYPTFDATRHVRPKHSIPSTWYIYSGVDIGSGGESGHPASIVFVGVSGDFRQARVISAWRGDKISTTNADIVHQYKKMKKDENITVTTQKYDWGSKDFFLVAQSMDETFHKAEKNHEKGEDLLNTLFKNDMLLIYDGPEEAKLATELSTLRMQTPKNKAKDDLVDALRYAIADVPFDFSGLIGIKSSLMDNLENPLSPQEYELEQRRKAFDGNKAEEQRIEDEFSEWNEAYS